MIFDKRQKTMTVSLAFLCLLKFVVGSGVVFMNSTMPTIISNTLNNHQQQRSAFPTLTFPASINFGGFAYALGPLCTKSMEIALDQLHKNEQFLPGYQLAIETIDDQCDDSTTVAKVVQMLNNDGQQKSTINRLPLLLITMCALKGQSLSAKLAPQYNFTAVS